MLSGEATNTNFKVFGFTRPGLVHTIYTKVVIRSRISRNDRKYNDKKKVTHGILLTNCSYVSCLRVILQTPVIRERPVLSKSCVFESFFLSHLGARVPYPCCLISEGVHTICCSVKPWDFSSIYIPKIIIIIFYNKFLYKQRTFIINNFEGLQGNSAHPVSLEIHMYFYNHHK